MTFSLASCFCFCTRNETAPDLFGPGAGVKAIYGRFILQVVGLSIAAISTVLSVTRP